MKLVLISDTHNKHNLIFPPEGDVLIHCGDATSIGRREECEKFMKWFAGQPHKYKVFIPGNHDWGFDNDLEAFNKWNLGRGFAFENKRSPNNVKRESLANHLTTYAKNLGIILLNDTSVDIEGVKFFGSPRSKYFHGWAFNGSPNEQHDWSNIPDDTEVLITHGPPHGVLDLTYYDKQHVGEMSLMYRVEQLKKLKLHAFGHIHEQPGIMVKNGVTFINASICNLRYEPVNTIQVFDLE